MVLSQLPRWLTVGIAFTILFLDGWLILSLCQSLEPIASIFLTACSILANTKCSVFEALLVHKTCRRFFVRVSAAPHPVGVRNQLSRKLLVSIRRMA